jgi:formylglycine-generating enzyme required for sulfatase activity
MTARPVSHPSPDTLRELAAGRLSEPDARPVLAHLEICPECRLEATTFGGDDFVARPRAAETAPRAGTLGPAPAAGAPDDVPPELRDHADFEVLRKLGGGGMGVVYLARDRLTHRQEVLKVVNPSLATQPGVAARFLREIRAVVQLLHPNIVTAYGALQVGGLLVLKMEYVPGEDLNSVVTRVGPLPVVNACYYAQQVAVGLQYAWGKGMVHRDIKPGNLILARDGQKHVVKILDFGLVKAMAAPGGAGDHLTLTAQGMGTPAYMAPEQARDAARADIRADIYSLGCTLCFLLAGRPPFVGTNPYDIVEAHHTRTAAHLNEVRQDVPAGLADVVARMLAKAPAQRYQEPVAVAQALQPFAKAVLESLPAVEPGEGQDALPRAREAPASEDDREAKPAPRKRPQRKPASKSRGILAVLLGAAGLLVLVGGGGAVLWALSGVGDRGASSGGEPAPWARGGIAPTQGGARGGPATARDVVSRVKDVSGIDLVSIPAGSFYMGSPDDDKDAFPDEKPQHKVTISRPFYLGQYKVTRGQFRRFVEATGHQTEAEKEGDKWTWKKPGVLDTAFDQTDAHPVLYVSPNDADAFCRWLAEKTGASARLPYEAEWEYSCRAASEATLPTKKYYFGDDESQLGNYAWYARNSGGTTHPCGEKPNNDFHLYDMHGLAWEWCADGKREYKDRDETDPVGPTGAGASRVTRGGSALDVPRYCRAASRLGRRPSDRAVSIGFRVLVSR